MISGTASLTGCGIVRHTVDAQKGGALIAVLLMLTVVLMLGTSSAQQALQGEKALRNGRDGDIALQAAEEALIDAQLDIEHSPRSHLFAGEVHDAFAHDCGSGRPDIYLGLCLSEAEDALAPWQTIDLLDRSGERPSVPFGHFTGRSFPAGSGTLPARRPRYLIERFASGTAEPAVVFYRITAIGFGMRESTQAVVQVYYRKAGSGSMPTGRFGWREVANWQELKELRDAPEAQ